MIGFISLFISVCFSQELDVDRSNLFAMTRQVQISEEIRKEVEEMDRLLKKHEHQKVKKSKVKKKGGKK